MAQKEIALQQVRTGKQRDLPDSLEKGQIGFSTDVGRVFVGLPSATDPSSLVAGRNWTNAPNSGKENVEILTEFTPWDIMNDLLYKPFTFDVPANGSTTVVIQSTSRLFVEYIGYSSDASSTLLESGQVQFVSNGVQNLISQQNSTNEPDGNISLEFSSPSYDIPTKRFTFSVDNSSSNAFVLEFIIRGWDKQ